MTYVVRTFSRHAYNPSRDSVVSSGDVGRVREVYAMTSDKEASIAAGLRQSAMNATALHTCCSLHAKWSECIVSL